MHHVLVEGVEDALVEVVVVVVVGAFVVVRLVVRIRVSVGIVGRQDSAKGRKNEERRKKRAGATILDVSHITRECACGTIGVKSPTRRRNQPRASRLKRKRIL